MQIDSISHVDVNCKNDSTGSIYAEVSGGFISNFTFLMLGNDTIYSEQGLLDTIRIENLKVIKLGVVAEIKKIRSMETSQ